MSPKKKRACATAVFLALILFLLGNEWVFIFTFGPDPSSVEGFPSLHGDSRSRFVISHRKGRPESLVHCVGENFLRNAWIWKSCQFEHLCYEDGRIFISPAKSQFNLTKISPYARISTDPWTQQVSSSALQPPWVAQQRYMWFPDILSDPDMDGFYELPPSVVWIPMTLDPSFLLRPSSILFDILLPIYMLTTLFGWEDRPVLFTPLDNVERCLQEPDECYPTALRPYLELLNLAPTSYFFSLLPRFCARRAAAGVGALTDHGAKRHGDRPADYQKSHNVGKGPLLFAFRRYCLENARIRESTLTWPVRAVWAAEQERKDAFQKQSSFLEGHEDLSKLLQPIQVSLSEFSFKEQLTLAVNSTFWIAGAGEDSVPAFFMPRGGTLILYYEKDESGGRPAMLHWDLLNHASHLTVHWLPGGTMVAEEGLELLKQIMHLGLNYLREKDTSHNLLDRPEVSALGHPLSWTKPGEGVTSSAHCLGDNFVDAQAPCYRSCSYRKLCLDVAKGEFQLELSREQAALQESVAMSHHNFQIVATDINQTVMHGRNVRFSENKPWSPAVVGPSEEGYFSLPSSVLWIPYFLDAGFAGNLGHFCWDFLLPFYTLLTMYGFADKDGMPRQLVLTSIDDECRNTEKCAGLVGKFMPLMGIEEIFSVDHLKISATENGEQVKRICAHDGAAGIGMLTDHGSTRHGQGFVDYQQVHNAGRGAHFFAFRNFMLRNLGIEETSVEKRSRHGVMFSVNSSTSQSRRKSFEKQIAVSRESLSDIAFVSGAELSRFSLTDQMKIIMQLSVFVSTAGGSTAACMFLPRHASLILYFASDEDFVSRSPRKDFPTMMDFDFHNNASYLRVHWLPTGSMDDDFHLEFLVDLIRSELAHTERFRNET